MESSASAGRVASAVLDPRRWWALALLCGAFFMVFLDGTITIVALPSIGAGLRFSEQGLQWVLSAYALTFGGLLLLGGRAADLLGRRRVFMAGVVCFTAASLLCGLAWSSAALLAARVVQGVGAAIMTPTALSIISTTFTEGSERNKALGIWGALGGVGATTAWLIGGPLVDGPGWRWIFFINVPIGLAALALSPVLLRESRAALTRRSYDPAGALTITGALVLLVYAVVEAPGAGWGDVRTILPLAGSAVLVAAFTLIESRHPAPLVPLRIFSSRTLAGADALTVLIGTVAVGMPFVRRSMPSRCSAIRPSSSASARSCSRSGPRPARSPARPPWARPASARSPRPAWRSWPRGRSCSRRSQYTAATSRTSSPGCCCAVWGSAGPS
jgi:MFS family permease